VKEVNKWIFTGDSQADDLYNAALVQGIMNMSKNAEFIQSLIRLSIGLLTYIYISYGIDSGYFDVSHHALNVFTSAFAAISAVILLSLYWLPACKPRRYLALAFDVTSATLSAWFTGGINSVYVLVYLWIYIGYGSRYGKRFLLAAVAFTFIGYNVLLVSENAWTILTLDAIAFLLLIIALPFYLYSLQKRLQIAVEESEQANRAKSEFLSTMTHQIRTPIGGVVGMIDLLNKTNLSDQQKQYLQALNQSSNALQEIIEDVVDFSQIEAGNVSLENKSFQPRPLLNSLLHSLATLAHEKGIELQYYISETFPWNVQGDAQRLRQLLSNLIRYAIEHCYEKEVYLYAHAGQLGSDGRQPICIEISYILHHQAKRIYTRDISSQEDTMALRIASQLTRLMDGSFDIQYPNASGPTITLNFHWKPDELTTAKKPSMLENRQVLIYETDDTNRRILEDYCAQLHIKTHVTDGADNLIAHILWSKSKHTAFDAIIVCDRLSRVLTHELIHRIRNEAQCQVPILYATYITSISHLESGLLRDVQATVTKPVSLEQLSTSLNKVFLNEEVSQPVLEQSARRILLAEDSEINASIIYSHLTDLGHNVDIATDGNTALYAMHQHHYDIVFMDIHMPDMDGIETTQRWRKLETRQPPLPIIAITAKATIEDRAKCMQAGMNSFLTKPISAQQLSEAMATFTD
jgi:two-component system, sensor histidine kinase RpfC